MTTDRDQFRRDIARHINGILHQLQTKEVRLKSEDHSEAARLIASCEVAALQLQYGLLQAAMAREESGKTDDATCFASASNGYVEGTGARADALELTTARLVKAFREAAWLPPLPWTWESFQTPGNVLHFGRVVAAGRYLIADVPGPLPGPKLLAYLTRAGALFPSLVREVVALRIALATPVVAGAWPHPSGAPAGADYGAADALLMGAREATQGGTSDGGQR